jgi:nucleotide-binding universal stress UspA family protein
MTTHSMPQHVIVGIDGSAEGARALAFAIEEARFRSAKLSIIYAFPALVSLFGSTAHEYYPQLQQEAEATLSRLLSEAPPMDDLQVSASANGGNPAEVLIEASRDATLLVVGSRGLGGFAGLVLGSVSSQCVQHAHCPVLVAREEH